MERDREAEFKRKWSFSYVLTLGYTFFSGCEYVMILPTVWDYLQTLNVTEEHWLGFTISIYSFAAAVAGLFGGRLADKYYHHTKAMVVISIVFRAVGNFQYMLGINVYNVMCARMFCGIATASGTVLLAEVCRITRAEERTKYLSMYNAAFQIGILFGPALQIILSYFDFTIFGFHVNSLNAPGLFMGVLWIVYWFAAILLYSNLTDEFRDLEQRKADRYQGGRGSVLDFISESVAADLEARRAAQAEKKEESGIYKKYLNEFLTDSYVMLMSMVFATYFSIICFETVTPVITQKYFEFGVKENTMIYMAGGIEYLVCLFGVAFIGKYVRETTLQIVGWFLMLSAQVWLIVVLTHFEKGNPNHVAYFLIGIFLIYLGSPIATVGNVGLSSKVLSSDTQGLGQGIRRLVSFVGLIFGPSWAGSTVQNPYLFLGVCIGLMAINGIMLMTSYSTLRKVEDAIVDESNAKPTGEETTPLLRSTT